MIARKSEGFGRKIQRGDVTYWKKYLDKFFIIYFLIVPLKPTVKSIFSGIQ